MPSDLQVGLMRSLYQGGWDHKDLEGITFDGFRQRSVDGEQRFEFLARAPAVTDVD